MDISKFLPEECLAHIISLTSPQDACRSALVSHNFQSAADSDAVWKRFLPSNYLEIISSTTASSYSQLTSLSKKELYFHLCNNPILINNGMMSFALEKQNGKTCYMIGARGLSIMWGHTPDYWNWKSLPDQSRFSEVAVLRVVWWLDIKWRIEAKNLSPKTTYAAYLVFKFPIFRHGFDMRPVKLGVHLEGSEVGVTRSVLLDPPANMHRWPLEREDGWMEIEMGEFYNDKEGDGNIVCSVSEADSHNPKHGIIIEGIELRPKDGK
ncbi:unnamed protein product [Dovyalis caffra]|uniref:F-box domain-containing protein n=1 Tax=Dovyalis caffra TaxID=77055 RepID=A0AAV1RIH8_9ROSI|nr:unnamed protein product [Dovyalis caffra]